MGVPIRLFQADGVGSYGLGYDDTRESQISSDLDADGVEAVIGSTPNLMKISFFKQICLTIL